MEAAEALRIILALADGVNPGTGERYGTGSIFQEPETIQALEEAARALAHEAKRAARSRSLPARVGEPWFRSEEEQVCQEFDRGLGIPEIARVHGRTRGGVTARLEALGKVPRQIAMDFSLPSGAAGRETIPSQGSAPEEVVKQDLAVDPYRPWLREEDARICEEFFRHVDLGQIGRCLGRNRLAVYSRLVSLGRIRRKGESSAA